MRAFNTIAAALLFVCSLFCLLKSYRLNQSTKAPQERSDTFVFIYNYHDSNIYLTKNYQVNNNYSSQILPDSLRADTTACDSVRFYHPHSGNDSVDIYTNAVVMGKLLDISTSYRFKKPVFTEKIIRIENNHTTFRSGIILGGGAVFLPNTSPLKFSPNLCLNLGYQNRSGLIFLYSGSLSNSHTFTLSKTFQLGRFSSTK